MRGTVCIMRLLEYFFFFNHDSRLLACRLLLFSASLVLHLVFLFDVCKGVAVGGIMMLI